MRAPLMDRISTLRKGLEGMSLLLSVFSAMLGNKQQGVILEVETGPHQEQSLLTP